MDLDAFLPSYDFSERHQKQIGCCPEKAYQALLNMDFMDSWILKVLLLLRGIRSTQSLWEMFVPLSEEPPGHLIRGMIARPWTLSGGVVRVDLAQFLSFDKPGYAKIVWGFSFTSTEGGCLVETETRIYCMDAASRRKFRFYWFFVRPFSGWVRRCILHRIASHIQKNQ